MARTEASVDVGPGGGPLVALLLVAVVIGTLLAGVALAQGDALQERLAPPPTLPAVAALPTATPRPTVALPTATPTARPTATPTATPTNQPSPTASPRPSITPTTTVTPNPVVEATCGQVPAGWQPYRVTPDDSLFELSVRSGAPVSQIIGANCLEEGRVYAGTTIYLPPVPPTPIPCGPPAHWTYYRVQRGDTMFALALAHGTTVYTIMQANCQTTTRLTAGINIFLPPLAATATPTLPPPTLPPPTNPPPTAPPATATPPPPTATTPTQPPPTATVPPPPTATAPPPTAPPPTATTPVEPSPTPPTPTATPGGTVSPTPPPTATSDIGNLPTPTPPPTVTPPQPLPTETPPPPNVTPAPTSTPG